MPQKPPGKRWRYIAFRIASDERFTRGEFLHALLMASRGSPLGDSFRVTVFEDNFGIIRVPHTLKDEAIGALRSMDMIEGHPCALETLKTSGTIKTLKDKYLRMKDDRRRSWP